MKKLLVTLAAGVLLAGCSVPGVSLGKSAPCYDKFAQAITGDGKVVAGSYACMAPDLQASARSQAGIYNDSDLAKFAAAPPAFHGAKQCNQPEDASRLSSTLQGDKAVIYRTRDDQGHAADLIIVIRPDGKVITFGVVSGQGDCPNVAAIASQLGL